MKNNKLDQSSGAANINRMSSIRPKLVVKLSPVIKEFNPPKIRTKAQATMSKLAATKLGKSGL